MHILYRRAPKPIFLKNSYALNYISVMKRYFAKDPLNFAARTTVSKLKNGETVKVTIPDVDNAVLYAHVNQEGLCTVIITDTAYPESAAKKVLLTVQRTFCEYYSTDIFKNYEADQTMKFPELDEMIQKYQDPKEADKLIKIESELNEIQGMLTKTMEDLMDRGEKLEDLMKQSDDISNMAYNFYSKSKDANKKCCSIY